MESGSPLRTLPLRCLALDTPFRRSERVADGDVLPGFEEPSFARLPFTGAGGCRTDSAWIGTLHLQGLTAFGRG